MGLTSLTDGRLMDRLTRFFADTVTIQYPTDSTDAAGGPTQTWTNLTSHVSLPSSITPRSQSERRTPMAVYSEAQTVIILASTTASVHTNYRAVGSDGNTYDIIGVVTDSLGMSTELYCRLEVN